MWKNPRCPCRLLAFHTAFENSWALHFSGTALRPSVLLAAVISALPVNSGAFPRRIGTAVLAVTSTSTDLSEVSHHAVSLHEKVNHWSDTIGSRHLRKEMCHELNAG
jgi:hypothetical protein